MKKMYQTPSEKVVKIQVTNIICGSDTVTTVVTNDTENPIGLGGGGDGGSIGGEPRSRMLDGWDEEY